MIDGLVASLGSTGWNLGPLDAALRRVLGAGARVVDREAFGARVHRLHFVVESLPRSLIVKRLDPVVAHRCRRLAESWLPAADLTSIGPGLLDHAADDEGGWHLYADFGDAGLDRAQDDHERVQAALRAIAALHQRFANHPILGECRLWGGDLGMPFYAANARDGLRAVEALEKPDIELPDTALDGRRRLMAHLQRMLDEEDERSDRWREHGGPETLVHGDLWTKNVFVVEVGGRLEARLIDWDHVAVSRFPYDISTLLRRFPESRRAAILEAYAGAVGWALPEVRVLNGLFDTAERARIANRALWPALSLLRAEAPLREWALTALAEVSDWFDALDGVLPDPSSAVAEAS